MQAETGFHLQCMWLVERLLKPGEVFITYTRALFPEVAYQAGILEFELLEVKVG